MLYRTFRKVLKTETPMGRSSAKLLSLPIAQGWRFYVVHIQATRDGTLTQSAFHLRRNTKVSQLEPLR